MEYHTPMDDIRFALYELTALPELLALSAFEDIDIALVDAVLVENARFAEDVLAPLNRVGDTTAPFYCDGRVTTTPGAKEAFSLFGQGGWQGLNHPVAYGGQGMPKAVAAAVTETCNAANLAWSLCPLLTDAVIEALITLGTSAQQAHYISPLLQGRWTGTMNLTEPQAGSDLSQISALAVPQPDGHYRLSGQKIFITYGEHDLADNIIHLVLARTPNAPSGTKGLSLFIVPKYLVEESGGLGARNDVWCTRLERKLGLHASPTAELLYGANKGDVGQGAVAYLLGEQHQGLSHMFILMNSARFAIGLQGVAISEAAWQMASHYAAHRVQGKSLRDVARVTIDQHPDVQRMLQTMQALTFGGRALAYSAAVAHDKAKYHPSMAERAHHQALYDYLVPIVKGFCTENAVEVCSLGVQVHGGMGYIEEMGAAQLYRDARILPIYEGTTAIQANDFLGRKTLADNGAVARSLIASMRTTLKQVQKATQAPQALHEWFACSLSAAIDDYEHTTYRLLEDARDDLDVAYMGSVPYLMLVGAVYAGWQLAQAALMCALPSSSSQNHAYRVSVLRRCLAYAAHVLVRTGGWRQQIEASRVLLAR